MPECRKAQRAGKRQALGGARRIHFRNQRGKAFAFMRGGSFQHYPKFSLQRDRSSLSGKAEGAFSQMGLHGKRDQGPGRLLTRNSSRFRSNCRRGRGNRQT